MVVGAGGTGSLVVSRLARINLVLMDMGYSGLEVCLIDNDKVEVHNLGRQMFVGSDVGRFKSEALISKINTAFGFRWSCETRTFERMINEISSNRLCNVLIGCVDNVATRRSMLNKFYDCVNGPKWRDQHYVPHLYYDCGNGKDFGQVIMCDAKGTFPSIFDIYGDMRKQKKKSVQGAGCSIWEGLHQQGLFVNDEIALTFSNMFWELLKNKRIDYHASFVNTTNFTRSKMFIKNLVDFKRNSA